MAEEKVSSVEATVRQIRRKTRKKYNAEEKMCTPALACGASVVLEGLREETSIAELCRREELHPNLYYPQGPANGARNFSKQANSGWWEIFIAKQTAMK